MSSVKMGLIRGYFIVIRRVAFRKEEGNFSSQVHPLIDIYTAERFSLRLLLV